MLTICGSAEVPISRDSEASQYPAPELRRSGNCEGFFVDSGSVTTQNWVIGKVFFITLAGQTLLWSWDDFVIAEMWRVEDGV